MTMMMTSRLEQQQQDHNDGVPGMDPSSSTTTTTTTTTAFQLTSTTAPGKVFATRAELANHYKSQWHKYNLKRREAGLPPLLEPDFEARLAAAQDAFAERQDRKKSNANGHLKKNKAKIKKDKKNSNNKKQEQLENGAATTSSQVPAYERIKQEQQQQQQQQPMEEEENDEAMDSDPTNVSSQEQQQPEQEPMMVEIDPCQSLFDSHVSESVPANVQYMQQRWGFFVPDREYLIDLQGLIGYCHEKIQLGHVCLYCQKSFGSAAACQSHMIQTQHCKLRYEAGIDLSEFTVFYDFSKANQDFVQSTLQNQTTTRHSTMKRLDGTMQDGVHEAMEGEAQPDNDMQDDDEDWEDVSDEEGDNEREDVMEEDYDDEEDVYAGYEREVVAMGLDVTPLGELIFPDGRIIGHRAFRRYYKQRTSSTATQLQQRESVRAARLAAADRLYQGRIVNLNTVSSSSSSTAVTSPSNKSLLLAAKGRQGQGLLVATKNNNNNTDSSSSASFTQLSIYRYRAAVRKQRRQHDQGQRLQNRTKCNMNRMDKKHNRLMNGVSVAHAAR